MTPPSSRKKHNSAPASHANPTMHQREFFAHKRYQARAVQHLIAGIIKSNLGAPNTQDWLVGEIQQVFDAELSLILIIDDNRTELVLHRRGEESPRWIYHLELGRENGGFEKCITERTPVYCSSTQEAQSLAWPEALAEFTINSAMCLPLVSNENVVGLVAVMNKQKGTFNQNDQEALEVTATAIASMISNARLIQQLKVANADLEASRWQLLNSRNTLRTLFDSIPTSIYIVDRKYNLTSINIHRAQRNAVSPNEVVGKRCYEALYQRNDICPDCRVIETLFGSQSTTRTKRQWEIDGETQEWEISSYPITDNSSQVIQAILLEQDVTEKRRLEATLAQSEKLAAVGQLAAGIAHEINNPLAVIIANAQLLQREIPTDDDKQELVDLISRAGARATQVVRNLLDLARKEEYDFAPTDLNLSIHNSLTLLQHEFVSRGIGLEFEPADDLPLIMASQDHLQGVWINLLSNAFDALNDPDRPREIRISSRLQGTEVRVLISDTGQGIPPERLSRIFEPFYTTKAPGRGTGLGLSVCHRIIKQHGGRILVDSQMGSGTQFTIVLPAS